MLCMLCVVAALYSTERNVNRNSSYPHYTTVLNLASIEFPMTLKDIPKFERLECVLCKMENSNKEDTSNKKNCIAWFVRQLQDLVHRVKNMVSDNVPMVALSKEQWKAYHSAMRCWYLWKTVRARRERDTRICDHCHLTGRYRDPAHANCNLSYN